MIRHLVFKAYSPSRLIQFHIRFYSIEFTPVQQQQQHCSSNSFAWRVQLRDLSRCGHHHEALSFLRSILRYETLPNNCSSPSIFPPAFISAAAISARSLVFQLHSRALISGDLYDPFVLTSLLSAYSRLSLLYLSRLLFDEIITAMAKTIPDYTVIASYNALISAYAFHSNSIAALSLFRQMVRSGLYFNSVTMLSVVPLNSDSVAVLHSCNLKVGLYTASSVANCLLTAYTKIGDVDSARDVFDELPEPKELISWNAIISGYAQNGHADKVLDLYRQFQSQGCVRPDPVTLVSVLSACANLGARAIGRDVDLYIAGTREFASNVYVKNALINMHARCGDLARARALFDGMVEKKTTVTWTAMISGYGMHGYGEVALQLFERMIEEGVQPDGVVMVSVLSACSHAGLAEKGLRYFWNMEKVYKVVQKKEHYACLVDLLGRAGRLNDAWELIRSMPMEPDGAIWGALLGACKIHKNVELGELAFTSVIKHEPTNVGYYTLMSNIYLDANMLDGVAKIRMMMKQRGLKKDPGCSYMELKQKFHLFMADDHSHPQARSIYHMIGKLEAMVREGTGQKEYANKQIAEAAEENAIVTGIHSEKVAIAFGLLNTEIGTDILVIKNLRVCKDCHIFIKAVSRITSRKILVRDASRFHYFEGGMCSCNDYW